MAEAPTDPRKLQQLKAMIVEMTQSYSKIDAERDHVKEIAAEAAEQFGLQKKIVSKIARTMYKHNYADLQQENEEFELLYETVAGKQ